jgi:alpha-tubulin suppressor-like RCC1 family protein
MSWMRLAALTSSAAFVYAAMTGCNALAGLDRYRACSGAECDAGSDGDDSGSGGDAVGGSDANADAADAVAASCVVSGPSCTDSSDCPASTPACSGNICVAVKSLAHGQSNHECALLMDCTLRCWGDNSTGALGTGDFSQPSNPVPVQGIDDVLSVGVGIGYTCALRRDKTVWCWGDDSQGALAQGAAGPNLASPTQVMQLGGTEVDSLWVGEYATCVSLADRSVWCWGGNSTGAVALNGPSVVAVPTQLPLTSTSVTAVAVAGDGTCVVHDFNVVDCFGNDVLGILGTGTAVNQTSQAGTFTLNVGGESTIEQLQGGEVQMCARHRNGNEVVYCWGGNYFGCAIADGQQNGESIPSPTLLPLASYGSVLTIEPSYRHSCALVESGDVYCWGQNDHGQSGLPPNANANLATHVTMLASSSVDPATEIAAHRQFTCALTEGGTVECWGDAAANQLGDGTTTDSYKAVGVSF